MMTRNRVFTSPKQKELRTEDMLKLTALLYFREALIKEQFEDCAELVRTAKEYGADSRHIRAVIASTVRKDKGGRTRVAYRKGRKRSRF